MASIKGTKTEQNLLKSFAGESQARNRYTMYASTASKEGYSQIGNIFLETAENERVHAKEMFRFLEGGLVEITATYPAGKIGTTEQNLSAAAAGENEEHTRLYPSFAATAREEGFDKVALMYTLISKVEQWHEKRYLDLLDNVKNSTVFKKERPVKWICRKCGYIHEGPDAPKTCPLCRHPQCYFEIVNERW
ncbi:MAG: rubrerythrin family protein [Chitinivibrionales bacterium]|nr:rubrerythrin family protein [Chitinivibrionales bacterium]